jgi:hypothetical protein
MIFEKFQVGWALPTKTIAHQNPDPVGIAHPTYIMATPRFAIKNQILVLYKLILNCIA